MNQEKIDLLNDTIKRYSTLKKRRSKIETEMKELSDRAVAELDAEEGKQFISDKGRITVVSRIIFTPIASIKNQIDKIRKRAKDAGDGKFSESVYAKFTVN